MLWFWLSLACALLWAIESILNKHVSSRLARPQLVLSFFSTFLGLLMALPLLLMPGTQLLPFSVEASISLLAGLAVFAAYLLFIRALSRGEASRIVGLYLSSPVFVALLALFFLGEQLSLPNYAGILLVVAGAAAMAYRKGSFFLGSGSLEALASSLIYSCMNVSLDYSAESIGAFASFFWFQAGFFAAGAAYALIHRRELAEYFRGARTALAGAVGAGICGNAGRVFLLLAFSVGSVSLSVAVQYTEAFFVLILASLLSAYYPKILKEETGTSAIALKLFATVLMFAGVLLLI